MPFINTLFAKVPEEKYQRRTDYKLQGTVKM